MKINLRKVIKDEAIADELGQSIEDFMSSSLNNALTPKSPFEIGKSYLLRTITMVDIGRVSKICGKFIIMEDASWIADTGRFYECLQKSDIFAEVEPFKHPLIVNTEAIVDATLWPYKLPTEPK